MPFQKVTNTLSEQKRAVKGGQNPFPIYNAVNVKDGPTGLQFDAGEYPASVLLPVAGGLEVTEVTWV